MKNKITMAIAVAFFVIVGLNGSVTAKEWKVDPAHSSIYFRIDHIYSKVNGHFPEFVGKIKFDPDNLKESQLAFTVNVKSINTNNGKRDGHLQSGDFFDAKKFPEMTFQSQSITHKEGNQYSVAGVMKVKDVSKNVELPFTYFGTKPNPFNPKQEVAGFEAHLTIDRMTYGVGNGKFLDMGVVGKDADVLISLEATRDK